MRPLPTLFLWIIMLCGLQGIGPVIFAQQSLSGNYSMQSGDVTLSLIITQQGNTLQGSLSGSTGVSFQLSGQVENDIGYGTCTGSEGTVYFEAFADGDDLTLSLVEPDEWGAPDYNQAQYLQFVKNKTGAAGTGTATGAVTGALGLESARTQGESQGASGTSGTSQTDRSGSESGSSGARSGMGTGATGYSGMGTNSGRATGSTGTATIGENEVGDPGWGIKFGLPQGWVRQQNLQGAIVGHNTIPGMVLVIPHLSENLQQMQGEMQQGVNEGGSQLIPDGGLRQFSQNVLTGDFSGVADGTQVKARSFGILSPNGGGAYVIALSTPDKFGKELLSAAESMVQTVQYFKVDVGDLVQHFAGHWSHFTSNTSTWICFCADGTYSEQYESSYSSDFNNSGGADWMAASQDSDRGRWTVRGNKDSGTIIVKLANGNEIYYEYQVHIERGQKYYTEYRFNGNLYSKK